MALIRRLPPRVETPTPQALSADEIAADFLREHEGWRGRPVLHAYDDAVSPPKPIAGDVRGTLTIGYGHTGYVEADDRIDEREAERLLAQDVDAAMAAVDTLARQCPIELGPYQRAALCSFAFNVGSSALLSSTTVAGRLRTGRPEQAADGLLRWVHGRVDGKPVRLAGLVRRREAERALFLRDPLVVGPEDAPRARPAAVEVTDGAPSLTQSTQVWTGAISGAGAVAGAAASASSLPEPWLSLVLGGTYALIIGGIIYWLIERRRKRQHGEEW